MELILCKSRRKVLKFNERKIYSLFNEDFYILVMTVNPTKTASLFKIHRFLSRTASSRI